MPSPGRSGRVEPDREDRQQAEDHQSDAHRIARPRREDLPGGGPGGFPPVVRGFFLAVRFLDDGEERRAGARRAVFWGTYTSMITGRMTGLRWVTS